jgi:hypothetical protein
MSSHPVHTDCVSLLVFIIPARGNLYVFCHVFSGVRSHGEVEYFFLIIATTDIDNDRQIQK